MAGARGGVQQAGAADDKAELHSALRFLDATGSVLHYGSGTRQHSGELEQIVFMQPQFIIDAIKYVVREPEAEDINAELRAMDKQIRNQRDLKSFHQTGELTRALLSEVWSLAKIKASDQRLMLEVMKAFRLLRVLGESGDAQRERYVVPAMLPHEALPAEYVAPHWWSPAKIDVAVGVVDGDGATVPAAMRVVYEVVGGRLPFSFMSELQVSLALPGSKDQHYAAEASVVDRVAGSVLSESYRCEEARVKEWAVVSQLARSCQVSQVEQEADGLELARDSIRVVAWAELASQSQDGATDWRLLRRVMQAIEDAEGRVPGLWLRKLVVHVDALGRCSRPEEVADDFHDRDLVTFTFDEGEDHDVSPAMVIPRSNALTALVRRKTATVGGPKVCIDAFFAKTASDMTIDVHREGQLMQRIIQNPACGWECFMNPQPTLADFESSMQSAAERNVKIVHLSGHSRRECGFVWNADDAATASAEISIDFIARMIGGAWGVGVWQPQRVHDVQDGADAAGGRGAGCAVLEDGSARRHCARAVRTLLPLFDAAFERRDSAEELPHRL